MLQGLSLLGTDPATPGPSTFRATSPATGSLLDPAFHTASPGDIDRAVAEAETAFLALREAGGPGRAAFLRAVAAGLEGAQDELVPRAMEETALPRPRILGELARTCFQLRLFAEVAAEGSWIGARLDPGDPSRAPLPRPDLRSMLEPLGPVAVFGASNFPLAFGVLGGDTASALAAGCPVVAKAHPLNPGTSEIAARVARAAALQCGLPVGVLTLLFDGGLEVGAGLARHPGIRALGFTGSFQGGKALLDLAASRPEPIPVFAEMGSVNPVCILPAALASRPAAIAATLGASVLASLGQLCTCPGLVVAVKGPGFDLFRDGLRGLLAEARPGPMLGERIARGYREALGARVAAGACQSFPSKPADAFSAVPALLETSGTSFLASPALAEEVFGPATILVACENETEFRGVLASLAGQLTATLWMDAPDEALAQKLLPLLRQRAGRILFNGVPTGVEVGHAMVHGGPWPATSAPASTSVGTRAIERWARPVCYQDAPEALLPLELQEGNPLGLRRTRTGLAEGR